MAEKVGLPGSHTSALPMRQASGSSALSGDAVPTNDPIDTSELLAERLQAWKHAVGYLEEYIGAIEKAEKVYAKEYEKVLKTIQSPLREGHHFDQSLGGVAGLIENMRQNTQGLVNSHLETEKNIKGSVLPILDRLHKEIKNKAKELQAGAVRSAKEVDKARNTTQKHIELLGQQTANNESNWGKMAPSDDPYVVHRGVHYRLNRQIMEENNHQRDLIAVQANFSQFEAHVVEVIQQAMMSFNQFVGGQAQKDQTFHSDMLGCAQRIPLDFEWDRFVQRSGHILIDPNAPDRSVNAISFPNQGHSSTKPLIEGTLERKSRNKLSMAGYTNGYYVVTPSKFLHEFKDNDNLRRDPVPELSIYLPDAVIGATNGAKFNIRGKDVSKGIGGKLSGTSEIAFKAHTADDAQKWFEVIRSVAGASPTAPYAGSEPVTPVSPTMARMPSNPTYATAGEKPAPIQTSDMTTGGEPVKSPLSATPTSALTSPTAANDAGKE